MATVPTNTAASAASSSYTYAAATTSYFPTPFHLQQTPPPPPVPYIGAAPPPTVPAVPLPVYPAPPTAQQLFQRDAQTITPEALESVKAALASSDIEHKAETKKKAVPRKAAGQTWEDPTLAEWPESMIMLHFLFMYYVGINLESKFKLPIIICSSFQVPDDYRLFCGDLGNEVNDDVLSKAFARFPSFNMARTAGFVPLWDVNYRLEPIGDNVNVVVRDKRTGKTKGYGFISFSNPTDLVGALKEMNGKYVGNRPIKLRKSTWTERTDKDALERQKVSSAHSQHGL
ncbi:hypothetical protein DH2020_035155 [Rehmannia glutinosa]|uniref:RRM domain-containing protein n=1 Tax=Rehmannia glutinosa TaxID=99300 RepID=A0ABR0VAZ4_REHGL